MEPAHDNAAMRIDLGDGVDDVETAPTRTLSVNGRRPRGADDGVPAVPRTGFPIAAGDGRAGAEFQSRFAGDREARGVRTLSECLRNQPADEEAAAQAWLESECRRIRAEGRCPPEPGVERIGPYRTIRELGRGGQATVWLAEDERLHRKVALKLLHRGRAPGLEALRRFRREAEAASRLDHPGICTVYDMGVTGDISWIAMRHVEGESLARKIRTAKVTTTRDRSTIVDISGTSSDSSHETGSEKAPESSRSEIHESLRLMEKAALALHAAHESGIIHRDVKPGNIVVTPDRQPVLLDFGLARLVDDSEPEITHAGDIFGTPAYLAPEQLAATPLEPDRRVDIWALGVTLYECLTLRRPFTAPTRQGLYRMITSREPMPARRINRAIPKDLAAVLATALDKDRDRRYQTALAFAEDLRRVRCSEPVSVRPAGPVVRLCRWAYREPAPAALLLLLLVTLPLVGALVMSHVRDRAIVEAHRQAGLQARKDRELDHGFRELGQGDPRAAVARFEMALAVEGGSPEAVAGLVLAHLALRRPEDALAVLDRHVAALAGRRAATVLRRQVFDALGRSHGPTLETGGRPEARDALDHFFLGLELTQLARNGDPELFEVARLSFEQAFLLSPAPRAFLHHAALQAGFQARRPPCRRGR